MGGFSNMGGMGGGFGNDDIFKMFTSGNSGFGGFTSQNR